MGGNRYVRDVVKLSSSTNLNEIHEKKDQRTKQKDVLFKSGA